MKNRSIFNLPQTDSCTFPNIMQHTTIQVINNNYDILNKTLVYQASDFCWCMVNWDCQENILAETLSRKCFCKYKHQVLGTLIFDLKVLILCYITG